jgi:hypothetical protein
MSTWTAWPLRSPAPRFRPLRLYQGCPAPQLAHVTQVVTAAVKLCPQGHPYSAASSGARAARRMAGDLVRATGGTRLMLGDRRNAHARFAGSVAAPRGFRVSITPGSPRAARSSASCEPSFITSAATIRSRARLRRSGSCMAVLFVSRLWSGHQEPSHPRRALSSRAAPICPPLPPDLSTLLLAGRVRRAGETAHRDCSCTNAQVSGSCAMCGSSIRRLSRYAGRKSYLEAISVIPAWSSVPACARSPSSRTKPSKPAGAKMLRSLTGCPGVEKVWALPGGTRA